MKIYKLLTWNYKQTINETIQKTIRYQHTFYTATNKFIYFIIWPSLDEISKFVQYNYFVFLAKYFFIHSEINFFVVNVSP